MKKIVALSLASALGIGVIATASYADYGRKGGKMKYFCSENAASMMQERETKIDTFVQNYLGLTAEQQGLYEALKGVVQPVKDIRQEACEKLESAENNKREIMKTLRDQMHSSMEQVEEAKEAFEASLDAKQADAWSLVAPHGKMMKDKMDDEHDDDDDDEHDYDHHGKGHGWSKWWGAKN